MIIVPSNVLLEGRVSRGEKFIAVTLFLLMFFGGALTLSTYSGNPVIYILFCLSSFGLTLFGVLQKKSFGFLLLSVFLWLGFWLKTMAHALLDYPFREPTGYFSYTPAEWDSLYSVASIGFVVCMLSGRVAVFIADNFLNDCFDSKYSIVECSVSIRKVVWVGVVFCLVLLLFVNESLGVLSIGMIAPENELPWVVRVAISWIVGFGLAAFMLAIVDIDVRSGKYFYSAIIFLAASFLLAVSQSSRAVMLLNAIPLFYGLVFVYKIKTVDFIKLFCVFVLLLFVAVHASNYRRYAPAGGEMSITKSGGVMALAVDRWIGLEGLMSVVSYPYKSINLFGNVVLEKRERGKIDTYTDSIGLALKDRPTTAHALSKQYAAIAGLFGFLYISGSWILLVAGILFFVLLIFFNEIFLRTYTKNNLLVFQWATALSFSVASLTVGLPQQLRYFGFSFGVIVLCLYLWARYGGLFMYGRLIDDKKIF